MEWSRKAGAVIDLACRGWEYACSPPVPERYVMRRRPRLVLEINEGVRDLGAAVVFHASRGEAERERDGSTATFTPVIDLPGALRAPATVLLRLQCGGA
jgi:hypothetical protein